MRSSTRNRNWLLLVRACGIAALVVGLARAEQTLPVFLSDNHAETFGWITRSFDPDDRYQLVLVDAHTDASMVERSEEIREQLRRVPSEAARATNVEGWRAKGRIQAFNWIEPLMPRPLDRVLWLAAPVLDDKQCAERSAEAVESLDGRLEVEPRSSGSFEGRWETVDLARFQNWKPGSRPIILGIDLDFFAGMEAAQREAAFEAIWQRALDWPGLSGVAFSVSRPWLKDDAEADALVAMACDAVMATRGAVLEIDASLDDRPDDSNRAATSATPVPRWDAARVSAANRERWLQAPERIHFTDRKRAWQPILDSWRAEAISIQPDRGEVDCDGVWRFPSNENPALRVDGVDGASGKVRWFALEPARAAYDLWPETGLGKNFSQAPARWIYEKRRRLGETGDFALAPERWKPKGCGRVRISAEVETNSGWLPTPPIDIRFTEGSGFHAALSECFGMPYAFGIAGVMDDDLSGVETGWGSDCSNFLIHAWRRNGLRIPWGDPGRLRAHLSSKAERLTLADHPAITRDEIERGLVIDFGAHVAALWQDRDPIGVLDGEDLVAHHLGGFPEIVKLSALAKERPVFALRAPAAPESSATVKVAGDVVLAEEERVADPDFERKDADLFLANLEGVPSMMIPEHPPRYDFRFPADRLAWLKEQGIDAVSLANNHAGDAGRAGLLDAMKSLRSKGIGICGAGRNSDEACQPWLTERNGVKLAVFGICLVDGLVATDDQAGIAHLPEHRNRIASRIREVIADQRKAIVLVHGGDEYQTAVNDEQRRWARWLANQGVSVIAGAHPHVIQREECFAGTRIVHSLGNAVYPKSLKGADSGEVRTFVIGGP